MLHQGMSEKTEDPKNTISVTRLRITPKIFLVLQPRGALARSERTRAAWEGIPCTRHPFTQGKSWSSLGFPACLPLPVHTWQSSPSRPSSTLRQNASAPPFPISPLSNKYQLRDGLVPATSQQILPLELDQ